MLLHPVLYPIQTGLALTFCLFYPLLPRFCLLLCKVEKTPKRKGLIKNTKNTQGEHCQLQDSSDQIQIQSEGGRTMNMWGPKESIDI